MAEEKFEKALAKLEDIVRRMEQGDMTLEESLKAFEEGIRLSRLCAKRLDEAERRIHLLLKTEEGLSVRPYSGETEESGEDEGKS
jgi:exodeoxyribonuclease VII small subunit